MGRTSNDFAKINPRLEKSVYENFEKFKYGMIKPHEFKKTLREAVNLPNLNVGYYDPTKQIKSSNLLQLESDKTDNNEAINDRTDDQDDLVTHSEDMSNEDRKDNNQMANMLKNQLNYLIETMQTLKDENNKLRTECGNLENVLKKQKEDFFRQVES